jgi:lysophospholipase L1-like esterase
MLKIGAKIQYFFELCKIYTFLGNNCTYIYAKSSIFAALFENRLTQIDVFMKKVLSLLMVGAMSILTMNAIQVHTIGDSTMDDYPTNVDKRGWGMYLGSFFDSQYVTVNNAAHSGRDTRTFYQDDWSTVKNQMNAGDYLIIQFAHNDEGMVTHGLDMLEYRAYCQAHGIEEPAATEKRGTNPQTTYRDMLRTYIDEARAKNVTPILVGPICRAYFSGNDISRSGQHDLGDNFWKIENDELLQNQSVPANNLSMSYVEAMRIVAQEKNVTFINMTEGTRQIYTSFGPSQCLSQLFCSGDKTHTNAMGANLIARAVADSLKRVGILSQYISIPTETSANPSSIAIGETYSGVAQNREFLLTGFGLNPESGSLTIEASGELTISLDKENYVSSATVNYTGGTLFQNVQVRAIYTSEGSKNDHITVKSGNTVIVDVPITAQVISLDGGSEISATWPLNALPTFPLAATCTGPVSGSMTLSNMCASDYSKNDFVYDGSEDRVTMVRFHNGTAKTAWPAGEIDENAERYIEFTLTAPSTMEVRVTKIMLDLAAHSTSAMACHIRTAVDEQFSNTELIYENTALPSNTSSAPATIAQLELTPTITIPAGETLHMRILPWHNLNEAKSGKYICVKNVVIQGMAFEPGGDPGTGINNTEAGVKAVKFFQNGQLMIEKNGVIYNAQGAIVK